MPLTACPECRHVAAVRHEQLGHRTRCPNCGQTFRPERQPVSFRRLVRAGQLGGAVIGSVLLVIGLSLGGIYALAQDGSHLALDAAAVCFVAGVILIVRHGRAVASRPQPIGARSPLMGTPGLEPGTKRL